MRKKIMTTVVAVLFTITTNAQNQCDACKEALQHGTTNSITQMQQSNYQNLFSTLFSKEYDYWSFEDFATEFFAYSSKSYSNQNTFNETSEKYRELQTTYGNEMFSQFNFFNQTNINSIPYEAWIKCISLCSQSKIDETKYFFIDNWVNTINVLEVVYHANTQLGAQSKNYPKVESITLSNTKISTLKKGSVLSPGKIVNANIELLDPKKDGSVQITFNNGQPINIRISSRTNLKKYFRDKNGDGFGDKDDFIISKSKPKVGYVEDSTDVYDKTPLLPRFEIGDTRDICPQNCGKGQNPHTFRVYVTRPDGISPVQNIQVNMSSEIGDSFYKLFSNIDPNTKSVKTNSKGVAEFKMNIPNDWENSGIQISDYTIKFEFNQKPYLSFATQGSFRPQLCGRGFCK